MTRLDELTREGAPVVSRCDVLLDGQHADTLPIVGGTVTYDTTRLVLRDCRVTLLGALPGPPTRCALRLHRGARDWTGEDVLEPVGVYALDTQRVTRTVDGFEAPGYDFSSLVSDAGYVEPYETGAGTVEAVIEAAALDRLPQLTADGLNLTSTGVTVDSLVWGEEHRNDPWADMVDLARQAGMILHFSRSGRLTMEPVPDPDIDPPAWVFGEGEPTYVSGEVERNARPYNIVVVRGEPAVGSPVEATAQDDNPHSPSFVGVYRKPYFMTLSGIGLETSAQQAADAELRRRLGRDDIVSIAGVPIPTLDVWRVIRLADPRLGVDANHVVDSLTLPLRPGEMRLSTRRRPIITGGAE